MHKAFPWQNKIWEGTKAFEGHSPANAPTWLRACMTCKRDLAVGLGFCHLRVRSVFLYHLRSLPRDVYFEN